ncbi:ribonuclease H-like domain-containing protein [Tanacetum coccineum]
MAEQDIPPPTITAMKIPIIRNGEYDIRSMRMRQYICHTDHNLWDVIVNRDLEEEPAPTGEISAPPAPKTGKQLAARRNQERVKSILLLAIPDEYLLKFQMLNHSGKRSNQGLKAYDRFQKLISQLEVHGAPISKEDINQKFLRSLPPSWNQIALIMRNKPDIDEIDIDDLYNNLRVYEDEMKRSSSSTSTSQNLAFLSSENTSSTNEIDEDDLEELDLRWQVAMLTVRVKKFIQKTGRNMDFKEKRPVSLDKSKIECYNCHRKGHFARECRSGRNQGKRSYGDNGRSNAPTNESSSQALVAQDGLGGYDWSNDFEIEPVNYALMAISSSSSSSSSDNEGYELALESLESRILVHEKNELAWGEKYEFQNYELKCREIKINNLNLELEKVVKERDELKDMAHMNEMSNNSETDSEISLSVFDVRSSDEENTPANDSFSKVDGFHAVPPPITGNFLTPRADISFAGKTNEQILKNLRQPYESVNRDKVIIEDWNSDDEDDVSEVQTVSPVKTNETQTVKTRVDKIGQTSQKQGIGFKKIKACFVCKSTDHLIKDCTFHDKQSQEPKLKTVVNTGPRVDKPIWDNTKRVYYTKPAFRPKDLKQDVKTFGVQNMTTAGTRAVVNTGKGKMDTDLKKSRWVWRPNGNYLDHVSKDSRSFMLKKGNPEIFLQDHPVTTQAAQIKDLKSQIKQLKKTAKPVISHHNAWIKSRRKPAKSKPTVHKDPTFNDLNDIVDDAIDYMETEDAQDEGRTSSKTMELSLSGDTVVLEEKESAEKGVSTEDPVSTAQPKVSTDKPKVSTNKDDEGTTADKILAEKLQEEEREKSLPLRKELSFFMIPLLYKEDLLLNKDMRLSENKFLQEIQLRNQMMDILKHVKRENERFILIGSTEDEKLIENMNKKVAGMDKEEVVKELESSKVEGAKDNIRKRSGRRLKMKAPKRSKRKKTDSNHEEENQLRTFLKIIPKEERLFKKFYAPMVSVSLNWNDKFYDYGHFGRELIYYRVFRADGSSRWIKTFSEMIKLFDKMDLVKIHSLVMKRFETTPPEGIDLLLWGDLRTIFMSKEVMNSRRNARRVEASKLDIL